MAKKGFGSHTPDFMTQSVAKKAKPKGEGFGSHVPDFMKQSVAKPKRASTPAPKAPVKAPPKGPIKAPAQSKVPSKGAFGSHTPDFITKAAPRPTQRQVIDWMRDKATTAIGMRKNITNRLDRSRDGVQMGKMYFYWYDAKWKDVLPMWDRFPLVIPIERYTDGFLGLNLHYLRPDLRKALLEQLMKYKSAVKMTESSRLKLSYELIKGTAAMKLAEPCIKRYLYSHVQSPFVEVQPKEWNMAMELPVSDFVYKKK